MATIGTDPNGHRRILFVAADSKRKTVRLGKMSQRDAEQVCRHVEALAAATIHGQPVARETAVWASGIGPKLHDRLARVGLVTARADVTGTKLGAFIDAYITGRADVKPWTVVNFKRARTLLVEYFGEGKPLAAITAGDADAFRLALLGKGLAENTVRRVCGRARQYFRAAIRRELVHRNPFDGIKCAVGANPARLYFVSRKEAEKVLAACPDAEWRLLFALSRYAGMRCPSEHLALRWGDVDWEHNRMTVRSPKTEHFEGKASRLVPIFPELLPHLRDAFEAAAPGTEYVITRCRDGGVNLRSQLERIIKRAGLQPWPKLFHNLRATRETELAESFPLHVVCAWIGNSSAIAAKHYLQVTDEQFDRATGVATVQENADQNQAQNPAQRMHEGHREAPQPKTPKTKNPASCGDFREVAVGCGDPNRTLMPPEGTRTPLGNARNMIPADKSAADSGASPAQTVLQATIDLCPLAEALERLPAIDRATIIRQAITLCGLSDPSRQAILDAMAGLGSADLPDALTIIRALPSFPPAIRAGILAMIQAAKGVV